MKRDSVFGEVVRGGKPWADYTAFCEEAGLIPSELGYRTCCGLGLEGSLNINGESIKVQCVADNNTSFLFAPKNKVELVKKSLLNTSLSGFLVIPFESPGMVGSAGVSGKSSKAEFKTTI